jgi:hypothetical protein
MRTLIVVLLVLSAVAELFGTFTVAINYSRGARVAREVVEAMPNDVGSWDDVERTPLRIKQMARQLDTRPVLTAGLVAYGLGAVTGLAAGLLAVYG